MAKRECAIDIETYSDVDIDRGVYAYVDSDSFEILLVAYKFSDEDVVRQFMPEKFRSRPGVLSGAVQGSIFGSNELVFEGNEAEFLYALNDKETIKTAYNANFERTCLAKYYGVECDPDDWRCTMVLAAVAGLPRTLKDVGDSLDLPEDEKKLKTGKALIQYFCRPVKATKGNGNRTRNLPRHDPDKWRLFCKYNLQDVVTEQAIRQKLKAYQPNAAEQRLWSVDQHICDRGIRIDKPFVEGIVEHDAERQEILKAEAQEITGLDKPNSVSKLKEWFTQRGFPELGKDLNKDVVSDALSREYPPDIIRVLQIRQALGKTSIAKYSAMLDSACRDDRIRGMLRFYGAGRTGRWSGSIVQLQNLKRNEIPDLDLARRLVAEKDFDTLEMLYGETGEVISELVRTALIPSDGCRFVVTDFSAIEARVIAWLAGEEWRLDVFRNGGDIYCQSASQMFHVPVVKHGVNGHLRAKGKISELACIAENQMVLTDQGLIAIQDVTTAMRLWDGEEWVCHEGVIYKGEREVITYDGLTATPDHIVYTDKSPDPMRLELAAESGAHIIQSGDGRCPIQLGYHIQPGISVDLGLQMLRKCDLPRMQVHSVDRLLRSTKRKSGKVPYVYENHQSSEMAVVSPKSCETQVRESERPRIQELRRQRNQIQFSKCEGCWGLDNQELRDPGKRLRNGSHRQQWRLCARKFAFRPTTRQREEQTKYGSDEIRAKILAVRVSRSHSETEKRNDERRNHPGCGKCGQGAQSKLAQNSSKVRVYDIRNAGRHHRFTVSGKLVHNCGFGGGVGAIKAMDKSGAIPEDEIPGIIERWRKASPNIVKLWSSYEKAALRAVRQKTSVELEHGVVFEYLDGNLQVRLPSGRKITYWGVNIGKNRFDKDAIHFMTVNQTTRKWEPTETWGGTTTENLVQATARDCLAERLVQAEERGYKVVAHVHDEMIIDVPRADVNAAKDIDDMMAEPIDWAPGLPLKGGTYECDYYQKD